MGVVPRPTRLLPLLALLLVAALVSGCGGQEAPAAPSPSSAAQPATPAAHGHAVVPDALSVLHAWDARRLRAWRRADPRALGRLYGPGSATGRADVRLLREYADHGLVVRDLRTQVFALRVLSRSPLLVRLRVTDRLAGGTAVRDERPLSLPATPPAVRVVELRRPTADAPWQVQETTRVGRPG